MNREQAEKTTQLQKWAIFYGKKDDSEGRTKVTETHFQGAELGLN